MRPVRWPGVPWTKLRFIVFTGKYIQLVEAINFLSFFFKYTYGYNNSRRSRVPSRPLQHHMDVLRRNRP